MKHRGRHRRRNRGRALRAALTGAALALTGAATLISTSQAVGGDNPGGLTRITSAHRMAQFRLHENLTDRGTLDTLTRSLGGGVGVHDVLASADHTLRDRPGCDSSETAALPVKPTAARAYCWDRDDATTTQWMPRSVTTSDSAGADGRWGPDRVILSGWTHPHHRSGGPDADQGLARIAFIDANDPARLAYRWVLLVAPREGGKDFVPVRTRMSGMVWHQDKLLVTARNSLLVFDLRRILRANVDSSAVGRVEGGYAAHGNRYVLPAVGSYRLTQGPCSRSDNRAAPCFAALSLDSTSTPSSGSLVAGEQVTRTNPSRTARVWRYAYSAEPGRGGLLATDARGDVRATEAYETEASRVRGVVSYRRTPTAQPDWYIDRTPTVGGRPGTLWRQNTSGAKAATCAADGTYACWGRHTASLSYARTTDELWTLTEGVADTDGQATGRVLYAVPLESVAESLE
ncbi:hypothetical protein NGF19_26490 [Streptomyces sp. RY43-2]|uniref:Secreted protein n=1 Tax=Streptomyces macrolidinus TaxID=2952607 RepID=A0ABT0ZL79_9ACTN|nr:hypothetical protein [Streptomyces macrolidinus]MCN9244290.1 hypothetical protein [Streptomyces macrolidinus]